MYINWGFQIGIRRPYFSQVLALKKFHNWILYIEKENLKLKLPSRIYNSISWLWYCYNDKSICSLWIHRKPTRHVWPPHIEWEDEKTCTDNPMTLTWFQLVDPSYPFEYDLDRSDQMVTVTNIFYPDLIKNHWKEHKHSISISGISNISRSSTCRK